MLKRLLILILIDSIVIAFWDYWASSIHIESMESIGVILIVPVVIMISGLIGVFLPFQKKIWEDPILINLFIALAIFIGVFKYESWKQQHDNDFLVLIYGMDGYRFSESFPFDCVYSNELKAWQ